MVLGSPACDVDSMVSSLARAYYNQVVRCWLLSCSLLSVIGRVDSQIYSIIASGWSKDLLCLFSVFDGKWLR